MHGNVRATDIEVGADTEIFGSLRAKDEITVGPRTVVHGDVTTKGGDVTIAPAANVRGDISCADCELAESADVEGAIRAGGETSFVSEPAAFTSPDLAAVEDRVGEPTADEEAASAEEGATDDPLPVDLDPAVVPLGAGELDPQTDAAVVPLADSDRTWSEPAATNGDGDVDSVIAEAETQ
jgi:hypothetical protein